MKKHADIGPAFEATARRREQGSERGDVRLPLALARLAGKSFPSERWLVESNGRVVKTPL